MTETPRIGHDPIPMRKREAGFENLEKPGDYYFKSEQYASGHGGDVESGPVIYLALPRGDGTDWALCRLPLVQGETAISVPGRWKWDGDEDKPDITPSIHHVGVWHGFVRAGPLAEA